MKKTRSIIFIGLLLCMIISLISCSAKDVQDIIDKNTGKLNPPTGIYLDYDNVLRWDSVANASSYIVNIDEKEYTRTTVACDLKKILNTNGDYQVFVKAVSNKTGISDSDYSAGVTVHYTGASDEVEKETRLFGQFEDIFTAEAYIGYGYDVIGSSYVNSKEVKKNYRIFDQSKILEQRLIKTNERDSKDEYTSGDSLSSYQQSVEAKLNTKLKVGKAFSGSLGAKFQSTSETTASVLFYEYRHSTVCYTLVLQCDFNDYRSMVTDAFKRDIMSLDIGTLFERYGTHFITSAVMGGRFDLNYTMQSSKQIDTSKLSASLDTTFKAWSVNVNADAIISVENTAKENGCTIHSEGNVIGGDYVQLNNEKAILANYQKWLSTIENKPALIGICDINSLVPIWELLGDSEAEQARKAELQRVFEKYGQDSYDALLERYSIKSLTYPTNLDVIVKDSNNKPIAGNTVYTGSTYYLDFHVEPEIAHITKSIEIDKSEYVVLNTNNNSIFIKKDTPVNTVLCITVDVGHGVTCVLSLKVVPAYTVDFICNGGTTADGEELPSLINIKYGSTIDDPEVITKRGYVFDGWYTDPDFSTKSLYQFGNQSIKNDLILYAKWLPYYPTITIVSNVSLIKIDGTSVRYNTVFERPANPEAQGYTFGGYYADKELNIEFDFTQKILTDTVIYVKWVIKKYDVYFEANGGVAVEKITAEYGSKIEKPVTTKAGYEFAGWYKDPDFGQLFDFNVDKVTGSFTLYAKWANGLITVRFDTQNLGVLDDRKIEYDTALGVNIPTLEAFGYTFKGWFKEETCENEVIEHTIFNDDSFANIGNTKVVTLYAKMQPNKSLITLKKNGGAGGTDYYYEVYETANYFDIACEDLASSVLIPEKTGYAFKGYYAVIDDEEKKVIDENGQFLPTAVFGEETTLTAKWQAKEYTLSVDLQSNLIKTVPQIKNETFVITYGKVTFLPVPSAEYYCFIGWSTDYSNTPITDNYGKLNSAWSYEEDLTLYANWRKVDEYADYDYISTAKELAGISASGKSLLVCDLDLGGESWTPISTFSGTFDGGYHTISNVDIVGVSSDMNVYAGLFGFATSSSIIKNIKVFQCSIIFDKWEMFLDAGFIVGNTEGHVENCRTESCEMNVKVAANNIKYKGVEFYCNGGGIAGVARNAMIIQCYVNDVDIYSRSEVANNKIQAMARAGGVAAYSENSKYENCFVSNARKIKAYAAEWENGSSNRAGNITAIAGGICGECKGGSGSYIKFCVTYNNSNVVSSATKFKSSGGGTTKEQHGYYFGATPNSDTYPYDLICFDPNRIVNNWASGSNQTYSYKLIVYESCTYANLIKNLATFKTQDCWYNNNGELGLKFKQDNSTSGAVNLPNTDTDGTGGGVQYV